MNKQKQAFTLVELIVVITILAILGTIAFISLQGYSSQARDSTRISDVSRMNTALELFNIDAGKYPLPDNNNTVSYSGEILRYQGTFGTVVKGNVSKLDKLPLDPSTDKEYVYSVSGKKNSYQILNLLEGDVALNTNALTQTNAATVTRTAKVGGVYNEVFVKTANYIVPTPSLITSEDITGGITLNSTNIKSQIITGGKNIPKTGNVTTSTGGLNIGLSVYNGTINKDSTDQQKIDAMKAIQGAYSGSILGTSGVYKTMLEKTTDNDILAISKIVISDEVGTTTSTAVSGVCTSLPANSLYYNNTTSYSLSSASNGTTFIATTAGYNAIPAINTCQYKCNSGYSWNGSSCVTLITGLIGYWNFDEASGNLATDLSGNGYTGTLTNGPTFTQGVKNNGILFDGNDDYVSIPNISIPSTATFSFWLKGNTGMPFITGPATSPNIYFCGGIAWNTWDGCTNSFGTTPANSGNGSFHHYVVIISNGNTKLYYDNILLGSAIYKAIATPTTLYIGGSPSYIFNGVIDQFRIYNKALSISEISSLYNNME